MDVQKRRIVLASGMGMQGGWVVIVLLLICAAGCTSVPRAELATYLEAMEAARQTGGQVLDEVAPGWARAAKLSSERASAASGRPVADDDLYAFDPAGPGAGETARAQIMLRREIWAAIERYSRGLAMLAERRDAAEVRREIEGFASDLRALSARRLASAAGEIHILAGLIGEGLRIIDDERRAQRFVAALDAGGPIVEALLILLRDEIQDIFDIKVALHRRAQRETLASVELDLLPAFEAIDESTGPHPHKDELRAKVNRVLRETFGYGDDELFDIDTIGSDQASGGSGGAVDSRDYGDSGGAGDAGDAGGAGGPSPTARSQLMQLAREIERAGDAYRAERAALRAGRDMLRAYDALLAECLASLSPLRSAAERGESIRARELMLAAVNLHWELEQYRRARRSR